MNLKQFKALMDVIEQVSFRLAFELMQSDPEHPIPPFYTRFEGRLESAVGSAFQSFDGAYVIQPHNKRLAALFYYMTRGHCFSNGNKRIALATLFTMLLLDKKWIESTDEELYALSQRVSVSPGPKKNEVIDWVYSFLNERIIKKS